MALPCFAIRSREHGRQAESGYFSVKLSAARLFGLIECVSGKYQLTRLAFEALAPDGARMKAAMARAFLNVPLYRRVYDTFGYDAFGTVGRFVRSWA